MAYDPFAPGPFTTGVWSGAAHDACRDRTFPCEVWYPEGCRTAAPVVVYSHHSGGSRRAATYLTIHLASHGYVTAALDHSETFAPELARQPDETPEQKSARAQAWAANRVPDIRFLLDRLLDSGASLSPVPVDLGSIGIVGHSIGGWTALAAPETESRIGAVVALAPGGASNPRPGIMNVRLTFQWNREIPALYLVAENDTPLPLSGMFELFERTPEPRQMFILRRADHLHFIDNVEEQHEAFRATPLPGEAAYLSREMRPIAELHSGEQAHTFIRGLTLAHLDATLRGSAAAGEFLAADVPAEFARRGIEALAHKPRPAHTAGS
jgi:dienelactone hydrolase